MRALGVSVVLMLAFLGSSASAEDVRVHGLAGAGHAVADPQAHEFGVGAYGAAAIEVPFGKVVGAQIEIASFVLSHANPPEDKTLADHGAGVSLEGLLGLHLQPFGAKRVAGLWLDGNFGIDRTGTLNRAVFDAHLGYDWRVAGGGRWDIGPFLGYSQVFQPDDTLRPEDAHILWAGVHVALGREDRPVVKPDRDRDTVPDAEDACPDVPGVHTTSAATNGCPPPRIDQDGDGIYDDEPDACPDRAGLRTADPKTNGCPPARGDRDHDGVYDDVDACPDFPGLPSRDLRQNGCPPPDRDKDGVADAQDACPDVPGPKTSDPKTSGCPTATDAVRVEQDQILLRDVIYFDTGSPRIRHISWPLVQKLAQFIEQTPDIEELDIEGHADEVGSSDYNLYMSRERAKAVKSLLVKFGVSEKKITTHAWGEDRPRESGHDEEAHRQNRRVEFTITHARAGNVKPGDAPAPAPAPRPDPAIKEAP